MLEQQGLHRDSLWNELLCGRRLNTQHFTSDKLEIIIITLSLRPMVCLVTKPNTSKLRTGTSGSLIWIDNLSFIDLHLKTFCPRGPYSIKFKTTSYLLRFKPYFSSEEYEFNNNKNLKRSHFRKKFVFMSCWFLPRNPRIMRWARETNAFQLQKSHENRRNTGKWNKESSVWKHMHWIHSKHNQKEKCTDSDDNGHN